MSYITSSLDSAPGSLSDLINLYGDLQLSNFSIKQEAGSLPEFTIEGPFLPRNAEEQSIQDIINSMTDAQLKVLYYLVGEACKDSEERSDSMVLNDWTASMLDDKYSDCTRSGFFTDFLQKFSNVSAIYTGDTCCIEAQPSITTDYTDYSKKKTMDETKGEEKMDIFNGMFGKVANGMCRLSMYGGIAVKTSTGYKTYNLKKKRLTNCSNFVFDVGQEYFFVIPTNKVEPGDIILISGKPKCVISVNDETITVINYEDSVVEQILPERHVFMGNTYFYGKIVSMFGNDILGNGKKGMNKLMSYMMMTEMMKGFNGSGNRNEGMSAMLPFLMMSGGNMNSLFGDIFNLEEDEDADDCSDIEDGAKAE